MKSVLAVVAGLFFGVLVASGVLAAFVFVGPDPVGLRPTPSPSPSPAPSAAVASASLSVASGAPSGSGPSGSPGGPSASPGGPSGSVGGPSGSPGGSPGSPGGSPAGSDASQTGFHVGQPAPPLTLSRLGGGTIDLANLKGKPVWLNFMQTTCPECVDEFPLMNGFQARYAKDGLAVIAVDIREDEGTVTAFDDRLKAAFPMGLDTDGAAQRAWGTYALPIHFWIDKDRIVRAGALGGIGPDIMAADLAKILPGVTVTP
jgi:cytochrome c biogenesis protein CcmG, thiol:disulfide interchange protein DsbE